MARIRSILPGIFSDPEFAALSDAAQIFYLGLLTEADDNGVFEWKPATLRIRLRPCKDGAVDGLLSELVAAGKIESYEIGGHKYGAIRNFRKFQRPKSPKSWHPITSDFLNYVGLGSSIAETEAAEPTGLLQKGEIAPQMEEVGGRREEGGGKDDDSAASATDKKRSRKSKLPADWQPTSEHLEYARAQGCTDPADTAERFKLHHGAKGTLGADWNLGFQYWCRNEKNFRKGGGAPSAATPDYQNDPAWKGVQ